MQWVSTPRSMRQFILRLELRSGVTATHRGTEVTRTAHATAVAVMSLRSVAAWAGLVGGAFGSHKESC